MRRLVVIAFALAGCGGGSSDGTPDAPGGPDAAGGGPDAQGGCPRTPAPADRARRVVLSRPYDASGGQASTWEVLDLAADGTLTRPDPVRTFTMGRAIDGTIAFTPDGAIGVAVQDDGSLGVFALAADGTPTVIDPAFTGGGGGADPFYASRVVMDPSGDRVWVLDQQWRENGGGIYGVAIGCDGTPTATGLVAAAKLAGGLAITAGGDYAIVAATDIASSTAGKDVHVVTWGGATTDAVAGADAFGDDTMFVGGTALTADGTTYLVGDINQFPPADRVAVVHVDGAAVTPVSVIGSVADPEAIAASPFGDVAVVTSTLDDALVVLDAAPSGAWRVRGEVAYTGASPQLPAALAAIDRGALAGRVLVAENVSIRQLAFRASGDVDDVGSLTFGDGLEQITGAIGVQP